MKIRIPNIIRWHPVLSVTVASFFLSVCITLYKSFKTDDRMLATLIGVHHLGEEYRINRFYIDKYIGDNVGQGGGGGGSVCCIKIPKKWNSTLTADVRWEVHHIIKTDHPALEEAAEVEGMYQAQVPVEPYDEPGDFYVHFFPKGRVRIVVSPVSSDGGQHPIQRGDKQAILSATPGSLITALFSAEELADAKREDARDRKKYGDWR